MLDHRLIGAPRINNLRHAAPQQLGAGHDVLVVKGSMRPNPRLQKCCLSRCR